MIVLHHDNIGHLWKEPVFTGYKLLHRPDRNFSGYGIPLTSSQVEMTSLYIEAGYYLNKQHIEYTLSPFLRKAALHDGYLIDILDERFVQYWKTRMRSVSEDKNTLAENAVAMVFYDQGHERLLSAMGFDCDNRLTMGHYVDIDLDEICERLGVDKHGDEIVFVVGKLYITAICKKSYDLCTLIALMYPEHVLTDVQLTQGKPKLIRK